MAREHSLWLWKNVRRPMKSEYELCCIPSLLRGILQFNITNMLVQLATRLLIKGGGTCVYLLECVENLII